jgi:hypothetical protein
MDFTEQDKAEEWFNNSEHGKGRIAGFVPILMAEYAEYYHQSKALHTGGVSVSLPDAENIEYLRGFIDGYGGEEPHDIMPHGFNDINEVWDKMSELKGNKA